LNNIIKYNMSVIGINYDGDKKKISYLSVDISYGHPREEKVFATGNFVKDWFDMRKFMIQELTDTEFHFSLSSSVDHFIFDGAPFNSAWLKIVDDKPVLIYDYEEDHMEFFVPEGTKPTWEELKEMCK